MPTPIAAEAGGSIVLIGVAVVLIFGTARAPSADRRRVGNRPAQAAARPKALGRRAAPTPRPAPDAPTDRSPRRGLIAIVVDSFVEGCALTGVCCYPTPEGIEFALALLTRCDASRTDESGSKSRRKDRSDTAAADEARGAAPIKNGGPDHDPSRRSCEGSAEPAVRRRITSIARPSSGHSR